MKICSWKKGFTKLLLDKKLLLEKGFYKAAPIWKAALGKRFFLKLRKGKRPKLPSLYFKKLLPSYPDKKKQSPTIVNCTKRKRLYTITTVLWKMRVD